MADLLAVLYPVIWAGLIIAVIACGVWVFFSIRQTLASTLVFDLVFTFLLIIELSHTAWVEQDPYALPVYLITLVTFFLNIAVTGIIFIEWRNAPARINEYILYLKFAISIIGVYTIIPLGLYYLRLYYLPGFAKGTEPSDNYAGISAPYSISRSDRSADPAGTPSIPQELVERYTEWQYLGEGGFARVFKVKKKDGTFAALKVPIIRDTKTGATFIAELQNWTQLRHENIVRVFEFNILPVLFFEMELCERSLADEKMPLSPLSASFFLFDICAGLDYSQRKGIIHRDLKPSNILICGGVAKISDWGLSRVVCESSITSSQVVFTPYYAAPEQVLGTDKDERTDVWQAGALFYELLTGSVPFPGTDVIGVLSAITTRDPVLLSARDPTLENLDPVIKKCLNRTKDMRYRNAKELQDAIGVYIHKELTRLLNQSIRQQDMAASARYCSELLLLSIRQGDMAGAVRHASELAGYCSSGQQGRVIRFRQKVEEHLGGDADMAKDELLGPARELIRDITSRELEV